MNLLISEPPQELISFLTCPKQSKNPIKPSLFENNQSFSNADIQDILSYLNPDMSYQDWINIGMALHAGGYDVSLWEAWSMRGNKHTAGECQNKWYSFNGAGGVSLGTLVHMAQNAGWRPEQPFTEDSKVDKNRKKKAPPLKTIHWSKLHELPKRRYLIKGILDEGASSVVYGASNSGKTLFALDMACHIAFGWSWQNKKIKKGSVIYIAGEGGLGISERLEAFRKHHGLDNFGDIYVIPQALILTGENDYLENFITLIKDIPNIKLIIIDTLARSMGDGDENYAGDMGQFIQNCDSIRLRTRAHVMVIHHTGKDESKGARGSSALKAAIDTEIHISQDDGIIKGEVKKQRDGKTGYAMHFEMLEYEVDKDEDGDPINSCALIEANVEEKKERLKGQAKQTYQVLCNLMLDKALDHVPKAGMKSQKVVRIDDFKDHFFKAGISDTENPDSISKAFGRQRNSLKAKGYIAEWDGYVWITDKLDN